jgi:RNA polymerase sigma-70 factor (ECF subfamily)
VVRVAARLVGSEDLAWDATQEALLALWNSPEPPANLSAWLLRAVRYRGLHLLRTRSRQRKHERQAAALRPKVSDEEPGDVCQRQEWLRQIEAALGRLPAEQREVFALCELEGKDYAEAAARLEIPVGTVRSRLHRARLALQRELGRVVGSTPRCNCGRHEDSAPGTFFRPRGT